MKEMDEFHKGDLRWYNSRLLYCEGRIPYTNRYLFVDNSGNKYELTSQLISIYKQ